MKKFFRSFLSKPVGADEAKKPFHIAVPLNTVYQSQKVFFTGAAPVCEWEKGVVTVLTMKVNHVNHSHTAV
jgi:hypothetical protein